MRSLVYNLQFMIFGFYLMNGNQTGRTHLIIAHLLLSVGDFQLRSQILSNELPKHKKSMSYYRHTEAVCNSEGLNR